MANTQTKEKAPKKAARKKTAQGKRYSQAQKDQVLAFVEKANSPKGRGGVAAAVRKFGINALTIRNWNKKRGASPASAKKTAKRSTGREGVLAELVDLQKQIGKRTAELEALEGRFAKLKEAL